MTFTSGELAYHHAQEHCRQCPGADPDRCDALVCPCGTTTMIVCRGCGGLLFVALADRDSPCEHWHELYAKALTEDYE